MQRALKILLVVCITSILLFYGVIGAYADSHYTTKLNNVEAELSSAIMKKDKLTKEQIRLRAIKENLEIELALATDTQRQYEALMKIQEIQSAEEQARKEAATKLAAEQAATKKAEAAALAEQQRVAAQKALAKRKADLAAQAAARRRTTRAS